MINSHFFNHLEGMNVDRNEYHVSQEKKTGFYNVLYKAFFCLSAPLKVCCTRVGEGESVHLVLPAASTHPSCSADRTGQQDEWHVLSCAHL